MSSQLLFVSGGSSGIGRALIETRPDPGARVFNLSRRAVAGVENCAVDLATSEGWATAAKLFEEEIARFAGERVVFVHAAGTLTPIRFAGEGEPDAVRRNVLLNSASPQILGDAFLRSVKRAGLRGDLMFIGSGASQSVYEGWSGYGAGKAAVDQWTRIAGAELQRRGDGSRVLCVAPGVVETAMQAEIRETPHEHFPSRQQFVELHDSGQLRDAAEVARELWALLERPLDNGAVLDLRDEEDR